MNWGKMTRRLVWISLWKSHQTKTFLQHIINAGITQNKQKSYHTFTIMYDERLEDNTHIYIEQAREREREKLTPSSASYEGADYICNPTSKLFAWTLVSCMAPHSNIPQLTFRWNIRSWFFKVRTIPSGEKQIEHGWK